MNSLAKRFLVALSFPGEHRPFVSQVAQALSSTLGTDRILYDKFHEAEFARPNLDTHLQTLYHDHSELVVVFVCADYQSKEWTGVEWRAIRDRIKKKDDAAIMPIRLDDSRVDGLLSIDGYVDAVGRRPENIAQCIFDRLRQLTHESPYELLDLRAMRPFAKQVERKAHFQLFDDFARCRDIVFALGGVGSGLTTFLDQFETFLGRKSDRQLASADFDDKVYERIHEARTKQREALKCLDYVKSTDYDYFDLKCLFATLAYKTYDGLHQHFAGALDSELPDNYSNDPLRFADYFFTSSGAMVKGDIEPIVEHFFCTVQRLAKATKTDRVIVFMPWSKLAECFASHLGTFQERLARELWEALDAFATADFRSFGGKLEGNLEDISLVERFDKVCLIVAATEVPYAQSGNREILVRKSLWPIPPLDRSEVSELLGMISPELADHSLADSVLEWTGGSPWYVRLFLSCAQFLFEAGFPNGRLSWGKELVEMAGLTAERLILAKEPRTAQGGMETFIRRHLDAVREALGDGQTTDGAIEDAWAGPKHIWRRGYRDPSQRVEEFVASGLIWLGGEPSDPESRRLFSKYPTLFFRRAGRLPLAVYRVVTGRQIELAEY